MFEIVTRWYRKEHDGPGFYQAGVVLAGPMAANVALPRIMYGGKSCESVREALESLLAATSVMVHDAWGQLFGDFDV